MSEPVVDILIRYDSRDDMLNLVVLPETVSMEMLYLMLFRAQMELRKVELQGLRQIAIDNRDGPQRADHQAQADAGEEPGQPQPAGGLGAGVESGDDAESK